jgi:biopolymer transport protein TolR
MGMGSMQSGQSGKMNKRSMVSEINVTPFVDVVLVLLVILMATAPLMYSQLNLHLPKTQKVSKFSLQKAQIILSIDSMGDLYVGKEKLLPQEVIAYLKGQITKKKTDQIFIRAHKDLPYGKVAKIMTQLKMNGLNNLSLLTQVEEKK